MIDCAVVVIAVGWLLGGHGVGGLVPDKDLKRYVEDDICERTIFLGYRNTTLNY